MCRLEPTSLSLAASFASGTRLPIICGQSMPQMDRSFRVPPPTDRTPPTLRLADEGSIIARSLHIRPQRLTGRPAGQGIAEKQPDSLAGQRWVEVCGPAVEMCAGTFGPPKCAEKVEMCGPQIWDDPNFQSNPRSQHISTRVEMCRGRNIQSNLWPEDAGWACADFALRSRSWKSKKWRWRSCFSRFRQPC